MFSKFFFIVFIGLIGSDLINKIYISSKQKEYNFEKMKAAIKKEEALKNAIIRYIIDKDTKPILLNKDLVEKGYISKDIKNHGFKENCAKDNCYEYNYDKDKEIIIIIAKFDKPEIAKQYANFYTRSFKGKAIGRKVHTTYTIPFRDDFRTTVCSGRRCSKDNNYAFWIDTSQYEAVKKVYHNNKWTIIGNQLNNDNTIDSLDQLNKLKKPEVKHGDIRYLIVRKKDEHSTYFYIQEYAYIEKSYGERYWALVNTGTGSIGN